jgi:KaiC/GvpD/RAD55 family RecA-like ATPase
MKCPESINNQFALLEELVKKIPEAAPEMKTALRDAILEMAVAYKLKADGMYKSFFLMCDRGS